MYSRFLIGEFWLIRMLGLAYLLNANCALKPLSINTTLQYSQQSTIICMLSLELSSMRLWGCFGTSDYPVDVADVVSARARGITRTNSQTLFKEDVAEHHHRPLLQSTMHDETLKGYEPACWTKGFCCHNKPSCVRPNHAILHKNSVCRNPETDQWEPSTCYWEGISMFRGCGCCSSVWAGTETFNFNQWFESRVQNLFAAHHVSQTNQCGTSFHDNETRQWWCCLCIFGHCRWGWLCLFDKWWFGFRIARKAEECGNCDICECAGTQTSVL